VTGAGLWPLSALLPQGLALPNLALAFGSSALIHIVFEQAA